MQHIFFGTLWYVGRMLRVLWSILGVGCVRLDMMGVHWGMLRVLWQIAFDSSLVYIMSTFGYIGCIFIYVGCTSA